MNQGLSEINIISYCSTDKDTVNDSVVLLIIFFFSTYVYEFHLGTTETLVLKTNIFFILTSSGKSLGWGEVNLTLISGSTNDTLSNSSPKRLPPDLCLYTVLKP